MATIVHTNKDTGTATVYYTNDYRLVVRAK